MSENEKDWERRIMDTARTQGSGDGLCAALRRLYENASSDCVANSLRVFAWDARFDAMPAKFRYAMLEAAKRLGPPAG